MSNVTEDTIWSNNQALASLTMPADLVAADNGESHPFFFANYSNLTAFSCYRPVVLNRRRTPHRSTHHVRLFSLSQAASIVRKSVGEKHCRNRCCWGFHPKHPRLEILKTLKKRVCSRKCIHRFRDWNAHQFTRWADLTTDRYTVLFVMNVHEPILCIS